MSKEELVKSVAECANITQAQARRAIDFYHVVIGGSLAQREKVSIRNFGTFQTVSRAGRVGRHPQTGRKIKIKATKIVKFKAGSKLKDMVR